MRIKLVPPNAPDQLPGRLERLQPTENQNAGPVNCIRLFCALFKMSRGLPRYYQLAFRPVARLPSFSL